MTDQTQTGELWWRVARQFQQTDHELRRGRYDLDGAIRRIVAAQNLTAGELPDETARLLEQARLDTLTARAATDDAIRANAAALAAIHDPSSNHRL